MCDAYNKDLMSKINKKVDKRDLYRIVEPRLNDSIEEVKKQLGEINEKMKILFPEPDETEYDK